MKLPKELTTITFFSRCLALLLFIALPFIGFYCGRVYQQSVNNFVKENQILKPDQVSETPISNTADTKLWKEFKDPTQKYTLNFPQNWLISFDESAYYKDRMDVHLEGPEGKVDILWADSYGGACQDPGYEKIHIKSGEEDICHAANIKGESIPDNTEFWQIQKQFNSTKREGIYLNAYSFNTNRDVVLKIIESLNITAK